MMNSKRLEDAVRSYRAECKMGNKPPTRTGLSERLGISRQTVSNVMSGYYAPMRPYTDKPSKARIISNNDFELIVGLFMEHTEGLN